MSALDQNVKDSQILIQITDTHLLADPDATFLNLCPEYSFHAVIEDIQQRYPEHVALLHTGDLAQDASTATYARYLDYMRSQNLNFYQIPGNHDDASIFPFHQPDPQPAVIELGPWCVILLNSAVKNHVDGRISDQQLIQLKQCLDLHRDRYLIIACHHHPIDMQSHWIDQHKLKNTPALLDLLQHYSNIKAVLCGHVHQDSLNTWNNIDFLSTPSTCIQFKPKQYDFALDPESPGYRCLHLNSDGTYTTEIHRLTHIRPVIDERISGY